SPELDGSDWLTVWVYSVNEWLTTAELLISEGLRQVREINVGRDRARLISSAWATWTRSRRAPSPIATASRATPLS
ncbi:MAG: hypothetical protein WB774_12170, partial [Xanthobacteraceae bacterium]